MNKKELTPHIKLIKEGPIKITGSFTLSNEKDEQIDSGEELYLCRCGKSKNNPWCDGSHKS